MTPPRPGARRVAAAAAALAFVAALGAPARAQTGDGSVVDLELVLLADASGSIDDAEIAFQRRGYAEAMASAEVLAAIASGPHQRIAVTYVEWGNEFSQEVVVDWMVVGSPDAAATFAERLLAPPRRAFGRNAIGAALLRGKSLIEENTLEGLRRVVDLSADSANNWSGPSIEAARTEVVAAGITINGLAVLCRVCSGRPIGYDLEAAFETRLVGGPGAFVVTADSRETFAEAVRRKLVLEITGAEPATRFAGGAPGRAILAAAMREATPHAYGARDPLHPLRDHQHRLPGVR